MAEAKPLEDALQDLLARVITLRQEVRTLIDLVPESEETAND